MNTTIMKTVLIAILLVAAMPALAHSQNSGGTTSNSVDCGLVPQQAQAQIQANASWYCPINSQIYSQWAGNVPLALLVVLLSFLIAALVFMTGVALNNSAIKNFGIGELYEAMATALIVVLFLYICAAVFGLLPGSFVGAINPYATSFNLMTTTITIAQQMYGALFRVYLSMSFLISPTVGLQIGGLFGSLVTRVLGGSVLNALLQAPQIFINLFSIPIRIFFLDPAESIGGLLADGILILYAEYYILVFFSVAAIPAFLIPGIFFRAIFPTRALGGAMIAMAIGFYLIMPSLFAVAYYFTAPSIQRDMAASTLQFAGLGYNSQSVTSASSPLAQSLKGIKGSLNGFWLLIFFYPALIVAITYTSIQEISRFIGRAQRISGFFRRFV